jgi:hypothetical protein
MIYLKRIVLSPVVLTESLYCIHHLAVKITALDLDSVIANTTTTSHY